MAAARPHSTQHDPPGAMALAEPRPARPRAAPQAPAAKPLALTPSAPWLDPSAWVQLAAGIASLALVSFPPQAPALPSASPARAAEAAVPNRGPAGRDGGFGSWQSGTRSCSRNLAGAAQSTCQLVQLDQQVEGLLTVRFIAPGAQKDSVNQLVVVGLLQPQSQPLLCQQGHCQPAGPLSTVVSTVSERSFDGRGLAQGLPKVWLASGSCRFEGRSVRCEAAAADGQRWQANANF